MKKLPLAAAFLLALVQTTPATPLNIATYNVRNDNAGDTAAGNGWTSRCPVIAGLVRFHDFDIFGTQEARHNQLLDMQKSLPGYAWTGRGRDDGKQAGEFSAIFYKTGKFKLLDHGDFWISPVTGKPNKGWDAALPRICSWAKFECTASGKTFYFFNLHMDHRGLKARGEGSKLVLEKIREIAGGADAILTGDFNMDPSEAGYGVLAGSGLLKDARESAPVRYESNGTFNGFKADAFSPDRIDYIFVTARFSVTRYGVLTDSYRRAEAGGKYTARMPSDHFPVMAAVEY